MCRNARSLEFAIVSVVGSIPTLTKFALVGKRTIHQIPNLVIVSSTLTESVGNKYFEGIHYIHAHRLMVDSPPDTGITEVQFLVSVSASSHKDPRLVS